MSSPLIDIVYTYVNSTDPTWQEKFRSYGGVQNTKQFNFSGEIFFSLRTVQKFFPWVNRIFIVHDKSFKKDYATRNAILVDDKSITIQEWNIAGGYGILHKANNYKETIDILNAIASPLKLTEILKCIKCYVIWILNSIFPINTHIILDFSLFVTT